MGLAGCLFFTNVQSVFMHAMATVIVFQSERPVFLREQANEMYDVLPYYMAKTLMEFPISIIVPFINTIVIYFGVGTTVTVA